MWLKSYLDCTNKETFGNATAAARFAGYRCKNSGCFETIGKENYRKLQDHIKEWIDKNALSEDRLKMLLIEGLDAFETKFFAYQGEVKDKRKIIPWEIRRKYLEMAFKVKEMEDIYQRIEAIEKRLNQ